MEGQKSLPHTTSVRALLRPLGCIRLSPGLLERIFRMTTFSVLHILNSSCHFSNTFGPRSPEILVFSRFPGIFSWPFPLLFSLRDVCKGKLSAFTRLLIQKPGGRTCGSFLCMCVDVHGGVHAGKAQQLSDIFKDAPP